MTQAAPNTDTSTTTRRILGWLLVAVWAGVIFWWSSKPGSQIPARFSEIGHLGEYLVFGVLLYVALRAHLSRGQAASIAILVASGYGVTDEFHQHFVVMRTPDVVDWGTDTLGATLGVLAALAFGRRRGARAPQ